VLIDPWMRRCWTLAVALVLVAAAGCSAPAPVERTPRAEPAQRQTSPPEQTREPRAAEPSAPSAESRSRFGRTLGDPARSLEFVSADGFKGVRLGMTLDEARTAYGAALLATDGLAPGQARCYHVSPAYRSGAFAFLLVEGRIARIDVFAPGPVTAEGVGVGSSAADVQRAYAGRVREVPYFLTVEPRAGFAIRFETDGEAVTQYRAGAPSDVQSIQGCP